MTLAVPAAVRARAEPGWLAALPERVASLCERWSLELGDPYGGATGSFVARATTAGGTPAVLKIALPDTVSRNEIRFLVGAAGAGYARVLAHDELQDAVLLEALGPSLAEAGLPPEEQLSRIADTLLLAWNVAPLAGADAKRAEAKAEGLAALARETWKRVGEPCSAGAVELAEVCAARRAAAFEPAALVTAHGDPHPGNTLLRLVGSGDLGVAIRDWSFQLAAAPEPCRLLRDYAELLAARTGEDATAIWEWGYLERVATGLYALDSGLPDFGRRLLAAADTLATS
jgi:streptomycin 6-kinase